MKTKITRDENFIMTEDRNSENMVKNIEVSRGDNPQQRGLDVKQTNEGNIHVLNTWNKSYTTL